MPVLHARSLQLTVKLGISRPKRELASCKFIIHAAPEKVASNTSQIHLHGHDFAILQVSKTPYQAGDITKTCPGNENFTCINPARRDVVMLPPGNGGYVVIAFKADNPGSWLMHCHIAYHASGGLALQILERLPDAKKNFPPNGPARRNAQKVCDKWTPWWEGNVQDDSGI